MRLIQIAEHYWYEIDGETALAGVDLMRLPFRRFLNAVRFWAKPKAYNEETQRDLERFEEWLYSPFEAVDPDIVSEEIIEAEMAAFKAFARQAGGQA